MIQSVGFTQDGYVFLNLLMDIQGQKVGATLQMERDFARRVAADMVTAADKADKAVGVSPP